MVYSTEAAKWKAYEFSDPFAAGSFWVCNEATRMLCRPDCEAHTPTTIKSEIKFLEDPNAAINLGFIPCESCDPLQTPTVDVGLLVKCVADINRSIGLMSPLLDDNEDLNNEKIKANILESNKGRRMSLPVLSFEKDTPLSKNDSDHYRLVDLACRHLALAAASNLYNNGSLDEPNDRKKRRRGGVLGFKELAAKSKLSAWHFHRVFKSVTGITPKTYGDKCWDYLKKNSTGANGANERKRRLEYTSSSASSITSLDDVSEPTSPEFEMNKRIKTPKSSQSVISPLEDSPLQMMPSMQFQPFQLDPLTDLSLIDPAYRMQPEEYDVNAYFQELPEFQTDITQFQPEYDLQSDLGYGAFSFTNDVLGANVAL